MSTSGALGIAITDVSTTAQAPLGSLAYEPATSVGTYANMGERIWVYVYNDDSTGFAVGNVIARDAGTTTYDGILTPVDQNPLRILGVAHHAIAAGSYGYILRKGIGEILAGTETIDVNEAVAVSAATAGAGMEQGAIAAAGWEASVIGFATEDAAAAATATCFINCPG